MPSKELNINEFISELNLLEGSELSPGHRAIFKTTYGLELNQAELEIYQRATGRQTYEPKEHTEVTVIVGRQGGKTSRIGAIWAIIRRFEITGQNAGSEKGNHAKQRIEHQRIYFRAEPSSRIRVVSWTESNFQND